MCDLTPMTTYIAELRAMRDEVQATLSSAETPDLLPVDQPLDRVSAGESSTECKA